MAGEQKIIGVCAVVVLGVGTANSLGKHKRLPSSRFLIGTGATFLILSALGEGEPDVAKALALAVTTTVVLGDGDGLFSYVNKHGEADTQAPKGFTPQAKQPPVQVGPEGQQLIPTESADYPHNGIIYGLPTLTNTPNIGR